MRIHPTIALAIFVASLAAPLGAQSVTAAGGRGQPKGQVTILEPADGALLNDETPAVSLAFGLGVDLSAVDVRLDGVSVTEHLTLFPFGAYGELPQVADGPHVLQVSVSGVVPLVPTKKVAFEVSTGGGPTRAFGFLLDPLDDAPIPGAKIFFEEGGPVVTTDASGYYEILDPPIGTNLHVIFDPVGLAFSDPQTLESWVYPLYKRVVEVHEGAKNQIAVCYLPRVEKLALLGTLPEFDCATSTFLADYTLSNAELEVELTIPAGTYCEFPSGDPCGEYLSIANVPVDKAPSNLPVNFGPPILITVQPTGMKFRSGPGGPLVQLPITFPNDVGIPPGNEMTLLSVDHELGEFVPMGTMLATPDGKFVTIEGGLQGGSWHAPLPPEVDGGGGPPPDTCSVEINPDVQPATGSMVEVFPLPKRRLFDEAYGPDLVYSSRALAGTEWLTANVTFPAVGTPPTFFRIQAESAGKGPIGPWGFLNPSSISEQGDTPVSFLYPVPTRYFVFLQQKYKWIKPGYYPETRLGMLSWFSDCLFNIDPFLGDIECEPTFPGEVIVITQSKVDVSTPFAVPAPAGGELGRGWRLSGETRLIDDGIFVSLHAADGHVAVFEDALFSSDSGLRMRMFSGASDTEVTSFFATSNAAPFSALGSGGPSVVEDAVVPNANFWNAGGPHLLHAGADGVQQTIDPTSPLGDDLAFTAPSGADAFGVLLEGNLLLESAAVVTFTALVDDAMALQIDGATVLSLVGTNPAGLVTSAPLALEAGVHGFRVAYADKGGLAHLNLSWSFAGGGGGIVPTTNFTPAQPELTPGVRFLGIDDEFSELHRLRDGSWRRDLPDGGNETFDPNGRITGAVTRHGRTTTYVRDPDGRLLSIIDPIGGSTTLSYVGDRVVALTDPAGRTTGFQYSGEDLVTIVDANGNPWQFGYDAFGLMTSATDAEGHTTQHEYDQFSRYVRATFPDATTKSIDYGNAFSNFFGYGFYGSFAEPEGQPITITNEAGMATIHQDGRLPDPYPAPGTEPEILNVHTVTDAVGRRAEVWSDSSGLTRWRRALDSDGEVLERTRMEWDDVRGLPIAEIEEGDLQDPSDDRRVEYEWHPDQSWLTTYRSAPGTPLESAASYVYDAATGEVVQYTSQGGGTTTYQYNAQGQLTQLTGPDGNTLTYTIDPVTGNTVQTVKPGSSSTLDTLDAAGNVIAKTHPTGGSWAFVRDAVGNILSVTNPEGATSHYALDKTGNLTQHTDGKTPPAVETLAYDVRGRLLQHVDQNGAAMSWTYHPDGLLASRTDRAGRTLDFSYDPLGRLLETSGPDGSVVRTYDAFGRLTRAQSTGSDLAFTYTAFGEVDLETETGHPLSSAIDYAYDARGRLIGAEVLVDGVPVKLTTWQRSPSGQVQGQTVAITDPSLPPATLTYSFEHDSSERRVAWNCPDGLRLEKAFQANGKVSMRRALLSGLEVMRDDVLYDASSNPISIAESRSLLPNDVRTPTYNTNQWITQDLHSDPSTPSEDFQPYDAAGNPKSGVSSYDAANQLLSDGTWSYSYDLDGNRVAKVGSSVSQQYEYDQFHRLTSVTDTDALGASTVVGSYGYDALGRRSTRNGIRYVHDVHGIELAIDEDEDRTIAIRSGSREVVLGTYSDQGLVQLLPNQHGDVCAVIRDGVIESEVRHSAFGRKLATVGMPLVTNLNFDFMGVILDSESGLLHTEARAYDGKTGTFLQREPLYLPALGVAPSALTYGFGAHSPYYFSDPSGLAPWNIDEDSDCAKEFQRKEKACHLAVTVAGGLIGLAIKFNPVVALFGGALGQLIGDDLCESAFDKNDAGCPFDCPPDSIDCQEANISRAVGRSLKEYMLQQINEQRQADCRASPMGLPYGHKE